MMFTCYQNSAPAFAARAHVTTTSARHAHGSVNAVAFTDAHYNAANACNRSMVAMIIIVYFA